MPALAQCKNVYLLRITIVDGHATSEVVDATLPSLRVTARIDGRTLVIAAADVGGTPEPSLALTRLTLDAAEVTAQATYEDSTAVWHYAVPSAVATQSIAWTICATNVVGATAKSGVVEVAPDLGPPEAMAAPILAAGAGALSLQLAPEPTAIPAISAYDFEVARAADLQFSAPLAGWSVPASARGSTINIADVDAGRYVARNRAHNRVGNAPWSESSAPVEIQRYPTPALRMLDNLVDADTSGGMAMVATVDGASLAIVDKIKPENTFDGDPGLFFDKALRYDADGALIADPGDMLRIFTTQLPYTPDAGTLVVRFREKHTSDSYSASFVSLVKNSATRLNLIVENDGEIRFEIINQGKNQVLTRLGTIPNETFGNVALSWSEDNFVGCLDNNAIKAETIMSLPSFNYFAISRNHRSGAFMIYITHLLYLPRRQPDDWIRSINLETLAAEPVLARALLDETGAALLDHDGMPLVQEMA